MSLALAALLFGAAEPPTIVVTAPRTREALAECLALKCPVREDALASIRHAQAQFADGKYPDARKTLLASLARNRGKDREDPRAMSALWHALARVTLHNGDVDEYRKAALRSGSILSKAESVTLTERVRGEVQIADALSTTGDPDGAVRRYKSVATAARSRGDVELAQLMDLRAIYARSTFDGRPAARRALERAAADLTLTPRARMGALALAAQLQRIQSGKADDLLDQVPVQPADAPLTLLREPPNSIGTQREAVNRALANGDTSFLNLLLKASPDYYSWADIGFWVRPDGRVAEVEVLRGSRMRDWTREIVKSVESRRYAPFAAGSDSEGRYKIERVTRTSEHRTPTGSLIRRRGGLPMYQFEELKIEGGPAAPATQP